MSEHLLTGRRNATQNYDPYDFSSLALTDQMKKKLEVVQKNPEKAKNLIYELLERGILDRPAGRYLIKEIANSHLKQIESKWGLCDAVEGERVRDLICQEILARLKRGEDLEALSEKSPDLDALALLLNPLGKLGESLMAIDFWWEEVENWSVLTTRWLNDDLDERVITPMDEYLKRKILAQLANMYRQLDLITGRSEWCVPDLTQDITHISQERILPGKDFHTLCGIHSRCSTLPRGHTVGVFSLLRQEKKCEECTNKVLSHPAASDLALNKKPWMDDPGVGWWALDKKGAVAFKIAAEKCVAELKAHWKREGQVALSRPSLCVVHPLLHDVLIKDLALREDAFWRYSTPATFTWQRDKRPLLRKLSPKRQRYVTYELLKGMAKGKAVTRNLKQRLARWHRV